MNPDDWTWLQEGLKKAPSSDNRTQVETDVSRCFFPPSLMNAGSSAECPFNLVNTWSRRAVHKTADMYSFNHSFQLRG